MKNIRDVVESAVKRNPSKEYFFYQDKVFTYEEFDRNINQVANGFLKLGIKKGDRVAVMMANCPELVFIWLGLNKIGACFAPINTAYKALETEYIINNSEAKMIVVDIALADVVQKVRGNCPALKDVIVFGDRALEGTKVFLEVMKGMSPTLVEIDVGYYDEASILYTSGTTGNPKGCVEQHSYYLYAGEVYSKMFQFSTNERILNPLPFYHMNPQILTTMGTMIVGASMVMVDRFSPKNWWPDILRYKATFYHYLGVVPAMLMGLPESDEEKNLQPTRGMGAGVPRQLHDAFEKRFNTRLIEVFGMTETGLNFSVPTLGSSEDRKVGTGCFGRPYPGYEARIVDENDKEVPPENTGELVLRGTDPTNPKKGFMKEYYKNPEANAQAWQGGWFHTGDFCRTDQDGMYYFVDRKKDIVRRSGENIASMEIESAIIAHPAVMDVAVIPVPDPVRVEEVKAYIILRPGYSQKSVPPYEIIQWCEERIAYYKVPRYIEYRNEFPRTPTNKIQKQMLKKERTDLTEGCYDRTKDERFKKQKSK
jgi:crotonobetaine/carnitine-CoA ligase